MGWVTAAIYKGTPLEPSVKYSLQETRNVLIRMAYCRRLMRGGRALPLLVNGDSLDIQISVGNCTVLATSYDYFDGCHNRIYVLGPDGRPIDQLRMRDQFGPIREVQVISEHEIAFGYLGTNDRWRLRVDEEGFRSFSLSALLMRPNRFLLSKRHCVVHRRKGPPWRPEAESGLEETANP